jgi:aryl-phospho-beta-D-glucosidase BglC (GH1 family)
MAPFGPRRGPLRFLDPAPAGLRRLPRCVARECPSFLNPLVMSFLSPLLIRLLPGCVAALLSSALLAAPPPAMMGINLAGAEFASDVIPGVHGTNYIYPGVAQLDYYKARGIELIRLPFRWERLQRTLHGALDATELARIDKFLDLAEARGLRVILDMHNYGRYRLEGGSRVIGSLEVPRSAFRDVWERIAAHMRDRDCIWAYGIMNEPYGMGEYRWVESAQVAVDGIRAADTRHAILIPGDQYSGAHWWLTHGAPLIAVVDPSNNLIFEAHQYFDKDNSGRYAGSYETEAADPNTGVKRLKNFVDWCRANGVRGFVGEYGVPDNDPRWLVVLENALAYLAANNVSGTYWAGGPWWNTYPLSAEMRRVGEEAPQMAVLAPRGSGRGTRYWPPYVWYRDAIASGPQGGYTYDYKSATAALSVNFADPDSATGSYNGAQSIRLDYTVPPGGFAGAGMHITGGVDLAPNFARGHELAFFTKGVSGTSVRISLRDVDGRTSATVDSAGFAATSGSWQQVRIPLSRFVTETFTGAARVERIAFEGLPADNLARTVRLDQFVVQRPDSVAPVTTISSPSGGSFAIGAPVQLVAGATDAGGIDYVDFLLNGERVASADTAPYAAVVSLPAAGEFRLTAIAYDLHGNPGRSAPLVLTAIAPATTGGVFTRWLEARFSHEQRTDAAISGPAAAPFGDGVANLLRFASGIEFGEPAVGQLPTVALAGDHLTLSYRQRAGGRGVPGIDYQVDGISYLVEIADSLGTDSVWRSGAGHVEPVGVPLAVGQGIERVVVRMKEPVSAGPAFLRLRVTLHEP